MSRARIRFIVCASQITKRPSPLKVVPVLLVPPPLVPLPLLPPLPPLPPGLGRPQIFEQDSCSYTQVRRRLEA